MFKTFKKNSKWIMAIVGIVLMIVFFLPSNRAGQQGLDPNKVIVATVYNNQNVTLQEKSVILEELRLLMQIPLKDRPDIPIIRLLDAQDPLVASAMERYPDEFLMLVLEARHLGMQPSNDLVQEIIADAAMPDDDGDPDHLAQPAVEDLALVKALLDSVADVAKNSAPAMDQRLASELQQVSLNIVDYSAANYLGATTQPTDAAIQSQYEACKDNLANVPSENNPLGFGYKYPNRVKLEYIGYLDGDLLDPVVASKPDYEWDVEARRRYRTHPDEYTGSTTQPSTQPSAISAVPWNQLSPQMRQKVLSDVQHDAATQLGTSITSRISEQMDADWAAYQGAIISNQPPPQTSLKCTFDSSAYIPALAAVVENEFHVLPRNGLLASSWLTADNLRLQEGIGASTDTSANPARPFPQYATQAGFGQNGNPPELALWQPSNLLKADVGGTYFFRLTAVDPSHAAPLAEAHDQVIQDLQMRQAWNLAKDDADSLLAAARVHGMFAAKNQAVRSPSLMVSTGLFLLSKEQDPNAEVIPQYGAHGLSALLIKNGAIQALIDRAAGKPPIEEVPLPLERKIAIIALAEVHPLWTGDDKTIALYELLNPPLSLDGERLKAMWVSHSDLLTRTNYTPVQK